MAIAEGTTLILADQFQGRKLKKHLYIFQYYTPPPQPQKVGAGGREEIHISLNQECWFS